MIDYLCPHHSLGLSSVMALSSSSSYLSLFSSSTLFSTLFPSSTPPPPLCLRVPQASTYNVQIIVGEDEPEDKVVNRFRRVVLKAGVLQECRRRRFFENKQDKAKRKSREASRRNRKRRPQSRTPEQKKHETPEKKMDDEEDDNWELPDVDLPYC